MSQTLVQEVSHSDLDWLMAAGKKQKVDADRLLIKAGQQISAFYLLIDGSLTISVSQSVDNALNRAFAVLEERPALEREIIELKSDDSSTTIKGKIAARYRFCRQILSRNSAIAYGAVVEFNATASDN